MASYFKGLLKSERKPSFRSDIAGLRAVAVLLVLLCHFGIPGFGGGFIGPDIFFVISGYLITGLLVKEYEASILARSRSKSETALSALKSAEAPLASESASTSRSKRKSKRKRRGKISLTAFYLRRIRRILPLAIFVVLVINVYAFLNLNFLQTAQIKSDSIWTLLFAANIGFMRQATDYFAQSNAASPLQHYWSLAVEEQFYLIWPILFVSATRANSLRILGKKINWKSRVRLAVTILGIISFVWLLIEFTNEPTSAYFSTFSRAWELAFGAALSFVPAASLTARLGRDTTAAIRIAAFVALLGSIAIVSPSNFGYTLWIPIFATGLILVSGDAEASDTMYRLLSNRLFLGIGAISYSLYLWHWPIFVFAQRLGWMDSSWQRIIGLAVCFPISILSYFLIEKTFLRIPLPAQKKSALTRSSRSSSRPALATLSIIAMVWAVTYSGISVGINGVQAGGWNPQPTSVTGAPEPNPTSEAGQSALPAWTVKLEQAAALTAVPQAVNSELGHTQILDYPWKNTTTTCLSAAQLPARADGISVDECSTAPVAGGKHLVLLGDSFAGSFMPAAMAAVDLKKWQVTIIFRLECMWSDATPVNYTTHAPMTGCPTARTWMFNEVKRIHPDLLVLSEESVHSIVTNGAAPFVAWENAADSSLAKVTKLASKVLIVGMHPGIGVGGLSKCLNKDLGYTRGCWGQAGSNSNYRTVQKNLANKYSTGYLDLTPWLCSGAKCPPIINSHVVYADSYHFTPTMSEALAPALREAMIAQGLQ